MEQKQRNKIAWILAAVLAPLLIYLLITNVAKIRKTPSPSSPAALGVSPSPGAEVQPPQKAPPVDPGILAEQKRIAALLPESNPFNPSRTVTAAAPPPITPSPAAAAPPPAAAAPATAPDAGIKLTAILSRGAARVAMINGRFLGEGEHIAGWTIIKVNNREVLLKDGARQMILRLK